jgi:hypothetical protein
VALNSGRILVAGDARLWLAPVGTTMPANATVAIDDQDWKDVGYFTPDSLQFSTDPTFEDVNSHQSFAPTRIIQTGDSASLQVDLQEWSLVNLKAIYGGGTVSSISVTTPAVATHYKFSPPAVGGRTETAAIAEVIDGTKRYRLCIPRAQQREGAEIPLNRGAEATLSLRLGVLGGGVGDPWYWLFNDAAFAPAV